MLFWLALKWNLLEKTFSCDKTKTYLSFAVKLDERSNRLFSVHLMNRLFMWQWQVKILSKHLKKVKSSQASISINSYTELSKSQLFSVSIGKGFGHDHIQNTSWYIQLTTYLFNFIWFDSFLSGLCLY